MRIRCSAVLGPLAIGTCLSLAVAPRAAVAQQPAPPPPSVESAAPPPTVVADAPPSEPVRFTFDLHGGLLYRVDSVSDPQISRGGALVGLDALIGSNKWWAVGVGYDHAFGASARTSAMNGAFTDTTRSLDELWLLGRVYPWQNDSVALYVQLGVGPTWQQISTSGDASSMGLTGEVSLVPTQCSGRASAGLGLRGGVGVDVSLSNLIIFYGEVGVDQLQLSGSSINGCGNGMGAATFLATRLGFAFATGRIKPPPPPPAPKPPSDRDNDAILDEVDACPDQPGFPNTDPTKNGCPPPSDRDHDGIPDEADACPDLAGPPSEDPKKNGCPDTDGDGIIDPLDACPKQKGVPSDDPKKNGCPPDTDGDGITDDQDACPKEPGPANEDPQKNGCPLVVVRDNEIVINEQVQFQVDQSVIKKESDALLDFIAKVMKDHPEIAKIEVQGHTDNTGKAPHNKELSRQRATAVKRALVKRGVADARLVAKGYGQEKPIADNDVEAGRAKNRRVQFVILEKKAASDVKGDVKGDGKPDAKPDAKPAAPPKKK